ncbi:MAG TPA: toll/interleukin-1 receptor domain-containing protein [Chthoniobacterales bacterium]|nr:toll/interleukin-1 receptor domain-containing protein [Chthoniobacterales bacterium]
MSLPVRRYRAFISYRHLDNREENRHWAQWLHDRLEGYLVPHDLVRIRRQSDPDFPDSLYPIFRDEKELRPGGNLAALIEDALTRSDALVVLCSPRSAQSPWVKREIIEFKKRGLAERIIVVVIAGEPGAIAAWEDRREGDPNRECLPLALRFGVPLARGADDRCAIDWRKPFEESLRIDLRAPGLGGEGFTNAAAYRQALERADQRLAEERRRTKKQLRASEENYQRTLHEAVLKIIAGVLRVDLGELTRRDIAARSQRLRRALYLAVAVLVAVGLFAAAAVYQNYRRQTLLREASGADHVRAVELLREEKWSDALAYLARALRYWPENPAASGQLWLCLRYGRAASSPVPEPPLLLPGHANTLSWSATGN